MKSLRALPKEVVDYIKANPRVALTAAAGVGLAIVGGFAGPARSLKLAANPLALKLIKEVAERALAKV